MKTFLLLVVLALIPASKCKAATIHCVNPFNETCVWGIQLFSDVNGTYTSIGSMEPVGDPGKMLEIAMPDYWVDGSGDQWPIRYRIAMYTFPAYVVRAASNTPAGSHTPLTPGAFLLARPQGSPITIVIFNFKRMGDGIPPLEWNNVMLAFVAGFGVMVVPFGCFSALWAIKKGISLGGEV